MLKRMKNRTALILFALCISIGMWAQATDTSVSGATVLPDSVAVSDSLLTQTAKQDSLSYNADEVRYNYTEEQLMLIGNTGIKYQSSNITADSLQIDLKKDRAFTYGKTVMQDGDQVLIGNEVYYDVQSQTGMMRGGLSRIEKGYYYGEEIRKIDKDIYDADNGRFTTCDDMDPDFWFWAHRLRIYRGDKIVGKPVVFYVNHFPIFYFPFMTFSIRKGRHAGFLMPEPGYNTVDGKYMRNIAYYYPIADYADVTVALDLMEKTGWRTNLNADYTKRYSFKGGFRASYQKAIGSTTTNNDWALQANHSQDLGDKSALDVRLDFLSNKRLWQSSDNIDESLAQQLTSSISYRKPILSSNLNVGGTYTQDLINDNISLSLPSASYRMPTRPIYEFFTSDDSPARNDWWTNFSLSYAVNLNHTGVIKAKDKTLQDLIWDNSYDPADTTGNTYLNEHHAGIKHNLGISYNYKYRGWLNIQPNMSYNESWFDRDKNGDKWVRGSDYSTSMNTSFNVYGIKNFERFHQLSVRHILTPSAGISYAPDFRDNIDYYSFGGIGLSSANKTTNLNMGVDQKWQIKYMGSDGKTEKKLNDIISWSSRTSVNLQKDTKQFNALSHSLTFRPPGMDLPLIKTVYSAQYGASQDPYQVHWTDPHFRNHYLSQTMSLSGTFPYVEYFPRRKNTLFNDYVPVDTLQQNAEQAAARTTDSWSLGITHSLSAPTSLLDATGNDLRMNASLKVTTNWSVQYSNYYNLKTKDLISQSFNISRALHCWKIDISYSRRNDYWDYRIIFFNTALPDALKFQTHDSKKY